jgi:hypothetical protein
LARWAPALIVAVALAYYSQYCRYGLNLGGEGGTNAVLAMRLIEGQRPIVDTFLGYNLLWFYPLVALFLFAGPDYTAMRVFFFAICTLNAVLGYAIVRSVTRQAWLAFIISILLVLVPGMIFRNYMGLIGVLSSLLLLKAYVLPAGEPRKQTLWMAAAGAAMTVCFLIRIEPSLLLSVVWLGLAILYPLGSRKDFAIRLRTSLLGTMAGVIILLSAHAGVAWHAYQRGFGPQFVSQYAGFADLFRYELTREWNKIFPATVQQAPAQVAASPKSDVAAASAGAVAPVTAAVEAPAEARRARPQLSKIWEAPRPRERYFGLCLYYPIVWSVVFVGVAAAVLLASIASGNTANKERALVVLTTTGCSLSFFPQYFFFRPDAPHLSEFMIPFLPAIACSSWVVWETAKNARTRSWRIPAAILVLFSAALVPIYLKAIMPRESAGTIFRLDQPTEFRACNGVRVLLSAKDASAMEGLRDAVLEHSAQGEFVLVYPYAPTVNFMTDRPSYEYNLYTDDTNIGSGFQNEARERIEKFRPAVIVVDNRPINQTERSRFKNWASELMTYIDSTYAKVGSFRIGQREVEVYARPDKTSFGDRRESAARDSTPCAESELGAAVLN